MLSIKLYFLVAFLLCTAYTVYEAAIRLYDLSRYTKYIHVRFVVIYVYCFIVLKVMLQLLIAAVYLRIFESDNPCGNNFHCLSVDLRTPRSNW